MHRIADEMLRRTDEAARMISLETGKPIAQSGREWGLCIDQFRWYAEEARRIYGRIVPTDPPIQQYVIREPVGPVAAFTPWNVPMSAPSRKISASLAAGCSIILKPAETASLTLLRLADFYNDRDPDGTYTSNLTEANIAISCLDSRQSSKLSSMKAQNARMLKASPVAAFTLGTVELAVSPLDPDQRR